MSKKPKMHKCGRCGKTAIWLYLPSSHGINFFCDDCVPRGCTCNVMDLDMEEPDKSLSERIIWWSKETYNKCLKDKTDTTTCCTHERKNDSFHYEILDEQGRRNPCCEYDYCPNGYEREYNTYYVNISDALYVFNKVMRKHMVGSLTMAEGIKKIITDNKDDKLNYNQFMTKVSKFCKPYISHTMFERDKLNNSFYNSFRSQLYDKKCKIVSDLT